MAATANRRVGRYELLEEIGRGGVGVVYRARDTRIERIVALKTVPRPVPTSPPSEHDSYARFIREARAAGQLSHPNVVTVYDVGEDETAALSFIAMEFVEGESLDKLLIRRHRFSFDQVRAIGAQVAAALQTAHDAGVVHRDIKPANLLLTGDGTIKVADFGVAKLVSADMTHDGALLGSPSYMSPEQVQSASIDHRSDLFSLGTVLYELATLKPAFHSANLFDTIRRVASETLPAPRSVNPDIPEELERVIVQALQKDRDARFQTAAEMRAALTSAAPADPAIPRGAVLVDVLAEDIASAAPAAEPVAAPEAPEPSPPSPLQPRRRRGRSPLATGIAGVVLLAGVAAAGWYLLGSREPAADATSATAQRRPGDALSPVATAEPTTPPPEPTAAATPPVDVTEPEPVFVYPPKPGPTTTPSTPEPQPTPAAATPAPKRRARPKPTPTLKSSFPYLYTVDHLHRLGRCRGTLYIHRDRIAYDAHEHDKDDRRWVNGKLKRYSLKDATLTLVADERSTKNLGVRDSRYRFKLTGGELPGAVIRHLDRAVGRE